MKFIKPKEWITPAENMNGIGDGSPALAHIGTFFQILSYPIAAAVTGVGAIVTRKKLAALLLFMCALTASSQATLKIDSVHSVTPKLTGKPARSTHISLNWTYPAVNGFPPCPSGSSTSCMLGFTLSASPGGNLAGPAALGPAARSFSVTELCGAVVYSLSAVFVDGEAHQWISPPGTYKATLACKGK